MKLFRTFLILIIPFIFIQSSVAQAPYITWQKSLGGSNLDNGQAVVQTIDGGYVVAGLSESNNGNLTGNHGNFDSWIVKLYPNGSIEWQKNLGGSNADTFWSIEKTADGGYIAAGTSWSSDFDLTSTHGFGDYWIVKLDALGNIVWQKSLGGTSQEYAMSIKQTSDGGYIVAGFTNSSDGDLIAMYGGRDYWVIKLDAIGTVVWERVFGGTGYDWASSIQQTLDGGYIVAGYSDSSDGDITDPHGLHDFWIVKLDALGNLVWQKSLGGSAGDYAQDIQQTVDGGYIVVGYSSSIMVNVNGSVVPSGNHGSNDYWVVKLNSLGTIQWQKSLGGSGNDTAYSVEAIKDQGYIVAGTSTSNDGDVTGNHGGKDYWIVKLSPLGVIEWQKSLGGSGDDDARSIKYTSDAGYIVAGHSTSNDYDVSGNHGNSDFWVVKLNFITTGINDLVPFEIKNVYPNPFVDEVNIELPDNLADEQNLTTTVYDAVGKVVYQSKFTDKLGLGYLQSGTYFITVSNKAGKSKAIKIIKQN